MTERAEATGTNQAAPNETGRPDASAAMAAAFPGAVVEGGRLRRFARDRAESSAAFAPGAAVAGPLLASSVVLASGADAAPFLHGQLANQVQGLAPGEAIRSLLLNHKGHAMADAMVLRDGPRRFRVVVDDGAGDWVLRTLSEHVVFDEVELSVLGDVHLVTLQGDAADDVIRAATDASPVDGTVRGASQGAVPGAPADGTAKHRDVRIAGSEVTVWRRDRSPAGGYDLLVPGAGLVAALGALRTAGASLVGEDALDAARVAARLATAGGEGGDGVLPQEAGLEAAISYRKGCYLGQEIMARIEARGNLRRGLATLVLDGAPHRGERPADVRFEDRVVGRLGTVARMPDGSFQALAVLRKDLPADAGLLASGRTARRVD